MWILFSIANIPTELNIAQGLKSLFSQSLCVSLSSFLHVPVRSSAKENNHIFTFASFSPLIILSPLKVFNFIYLSLGVHLWKLEKTLGSLLSPRGAWRSNTGDQAQQCFYPWYHLSGSLLGTNWKKRLILCKAGIPQVSVMLLNFSQLATFSFLISIQSSRFPYGIFTYT